MKFKKGDIVRCINVKDAKHHGLKLNCIYIVNTMNDDLQFVRLSKYNNIRSNIFGFYSYRFKKVTNKSLTEEEKFKYIKYKLGAK